MNCIARGKRANNAEKSKGYGKPHKFRAKTIFNIIHWPADAVAIGIHLAVAHSENAFGKLRGGSQDRSDPHPENGTRAANGNRSGHACDIACANGRGERRHEGGKGRDIAFIGFARTFFEELAETIADFCERDET